uniref:Major facilitator superfamily (MFS) profile domain-containing protein n=1 Tax=Hyaloperonospora arabidopsidis (strain Emoy2) TaxID=559515 RepID=M4C6F8_HYAAE
MNKFLVRGLGFFNDAYDLFVMNIINIVLTEQYGKDVYTSNMKSWVSASALVGAVVGQLLFGFLGDVFGRRVNMIATCILLIVGGILCTAAYGGSASGTLWFLVVARFILGIGIGGEYPLAASSTAEDATSVADRNQRVALTFSLQGAGSLTAAVLGNLIIQALAGGEKNTNPDSRLEIVWRLLFGIGVIPAIVVCYWRVTAEETDAFKAAEERRQAAAADNPTSASRARLSFIICHYGVSLLGTAGSWLLFDIVFYAQNLFSASILTVVGVEDASLREITTQNAFVALMALPGYYVAVYFINRIGRRIIQLQGFAVMTVLFLVLAVFWQDIKQSAVLFIILYGLALFFSNFGPNMSTFVLPTEMFPTPIRSTCHGISAAAGKAGAAIGSFGFSIWVENENFGYSGAFYTFAAITLISIPLTWFCTFDNEQGFEAMDADFYQKLHGADYLTRESFSTVAKVNDLEKEAYKAAASPQ